MILLLILIAIYMPALYTVSVVFVVINMITVTMHPVFIYTPYFGGVHPHPHVQASGLSSRHLWYVDTRKIGKHP